ncbi:hypothetical protein DBV05_g10377 [Lasiodiplodia theobromae]|uniref:N-acetyltransferase domain-containing protein n=1 Tax=Lasiodiplodia theobromae TaxID=45133 RepID=A0A5N5CZX3_9PEZI|nr:hypothetical protein DBV05_g10377 [Lasiodiplodia theobromae]
MSQSVSFLPPLRSLATSYDRTKLAADQRARDIPKTFKDAMTIRERVYVEEQNVPLENEFDDDDPRSFHWVVYVSQDVSPGSEGTLVTGPKSPPPQSEHRQSDPTANRVAVGTIRLVPPPHPPHPASADAHKPGSPLPTENTHASGLYIKLGRLAVLPAYRKLKLAALLVHTALDWAAQNGYQVLSPPRAKEIGLVDIEGPAADLESWDGLALVHAQSWLERFWGKFGFVKDEEMGEWDEEGIVHCGMWLKLKLRG